MDSFNYLGDVNNYRYELLGNEHALLQAIAVHRNPRDPLHDHNLSDHFLFGDSLQSNCSASDSVAASVSVHKFDSGPNDYFGASASVQKLDSALHSGLQRPGPSYTDDAEFHALYDHDHYY